VNLDALLASLMAAGNEDYVFLLEVAYTAHLLFVYLLIPTLYSLACF
jgi:hypothetical protein